MAFASLVVIVSLTLGLSWLVGRSVASAPYLWLDAIHVAAFAVLALLAWGFARRSTRVVEELFRHEDRLMLAAVHEGNRPLSRLVASVDEGLSGAVPPEAALKEVAIHAEVLRELIEALIETARVATGAIPLAEEEVRVDEVAARVVSHDAIGRATVVLDTAPVQLVGSPRLLALALSNLVRNAMRHAYRGGPGQIRVRIDRDGVTIADDGPGMDEALLASLSKDGVWDGSRLARASLGLSIAGWVTEVHGGTMRLTNRPGGGFEVRLELPLADATSGLDGLGGHQDRMEETARRR